MMRTVLLHYLRAATLDCTRRGARYAQVIEASPAFLRLCRSESTGSVVTDGATEPEPSVSSRVVVRTKCKRLHCVLALVFKHSVLASIGISLDVCFLSGHRAVECNTAHAYCQCSSVY